MAPSGKLSLDPIFRPKSVAVIGASRREEAVGHAVFRNILRSGFQGTLYPVNPKSDSILGVHCYASIAEVPAPVDLGVLIVPAPHVLAAFEECAAKGVRGVIVISAGFKEIGGEGAALEKALGQAARERGIPLMGPNCLGLINTDPAVALNASFARSMPRAGRVSFISQSGALCTAVLDYAKGTGIGFAKFISMGNKATLTEIELLEYLAEDPQTDVILMYLEDLSRPREMIELCRRISGEDAAAKPILAIKSGRTAAGARAASSHTGSLAGSDEVYTAVFAQGGILRVDSVEELFDYAEAFAARKLPQGNRVAIVTNAGGPGIMATDSCIRYGLEMAAFSEGTTAALKKALPPTANLSNPVDVIGDARHDRYEAAMAAVLADPGLDAVIAILTPQAMTAIEETARVIGEQAKASPKPVLACFMGIVDVSAGERVLEKWRVPHHRFPESSAKSLAAMARYAAWVKRPRTPVRSFPVDAAAARKVFAGAAAQGRAKLTDVEASAVLAAYGFPVLPVELCPDPEKAAEAAGRVGFPAVLKISSPEIIHKVDVGGVRLGLKNGQETREAAAAMLAEVARRAPGARIAGVTVQKMAPKGREVILGMKRDPQFGPILMFGLGGTYVEIFKDVTFRLAPVRELGARNMIRSIRAHPILEGTRGEKPADIPKLEELLERLSQLAVDCPEIAELDLNPVMVYEEGMGCSVVDARILLGG